MLGPLGLKPASWKWVFVCGLIACGGSHACGGAQKPYASAPPPPAPVTPATVPPPATATPLDPDKAVSLEGPRVPPSFHNPSSPSARNSPLGVNLSAVRYYSEQILFLDLTKQAADWGLNSGGKLPELDENGYPKALAPGHGAGFVANAGKGGTYVILYQGSGEMEVGNGQKLSSQPGRDVVQLNGGETHFTITRTDPQNPMRDIHIVPIETEHSYKELIFDPQLVRLVQPFSVLRFMDYFGTNGSTQKHWKDRPKPSDFSQGTEKGGAIEYAIALCNRVQADCWFNIPHMADDDYVRHYAELVRDQLDPKLRAYVEYSNEVWNFGHGDWIQEAGERIGMKKEWDTRLRYQAHRSVEIFKIFEKALGKKRLTRVLAGQCWDLRLRILLDYEDAYRHADAIAIAPYFGYELTADENVAKLNGATPQAVVERAIQGLDETASTLKNLKALADGYHLPLIAYEAGQHLATGGQFHADEKLQKLLDDANRVPKMGEAYRKYLELWRREGGELMVLYTLVDSYSKWGRWGLLESMWQPIGSAPKYLAAVSFAQREPRWWGGSKQASAE